MKFISILSLLVGMSLSLFAQDPNPSDGKLFDDSRVNKITLLMPMDSALWLYESGNELNNEHVVSTFIYEHETGTDTVEHVGVRLRGNTSRYAGKKSIKISFNTFATGRKYRDVEKMNINGQHNDPTITRAKLAGDLLRWMELPSIRGNHVELYVNDQYIGVYVNTEHIDEEYVEKRFDNKNGNLFKCTWPADLHYKGDNPNLYKDPGNEKPAYELMTNKSANDYSDLAHFIDVLNNTSDEEFACEIEKVFNVDQYLKFIIYDILIGNWDGPLVNKNNFYLYHNTATDKFEYIPFDVDNTFGISWSSTSWATRNVYDWGNRNEYRPLYEKFMINDEYRFRFSYYFDQILQEVFIPEEIEDYLDNIKSIISSSVAEDEFYTYSYGFDMDDFNTGFESQLGYGHTPIGLKQFVNIRAINADNQLDIEDIHPIINKVEAKASASDGMATISAHIEDDGELSSATAYYKSNSNSDWQSIPLTLNNGRYTADVALTNGQLFYYIEVSDNTGNTSLQPRCGNFETQLSLSEMKLAINEVQASNDSTIPDDDNEFDDWVELYNYGNTTINTEGLTLTDDELEKDKWALPNVEIEAGEYLLIWADKDEEQGPLHANFKLSSDGEYIGLYESDGAFIDGHNFAAMQADEAYGRLPNGTGSWQQLHPTPRNSNEAVSTLEVLTSQIKMYPNPTNDLLTIDINEECKGCLLTITDISGNVLETQKTNNQIAIEKYPSGSYIISVIEKGEVIFSQKIIKL